MWINSKIGLECTVGDGAHASIARVEEGVPYLTSKNFTQSGLKLEKVDYITIVDYKKYFRSESKALTKPKEGDLIFSIIGSIGGAYLYSEKDEFGLSSSVAIIRPDLNNVYPEYLLYFLKSEYLQKWVESFKSGSAQGFLSLEMIRSLPLKYPNLPIQKRIASILSAYDDLIENNMQRIKLLEEMAEEIYKEWFVRMRFPGYQDSKFFDKDGREVPHGTLGALPEGWNDGTIGDLIGIKKGKNITLTTITEGIVPVVAGGLTPAYYHNTPNTKSPTITISASGANSGFVNLYYEDIWASDCSFVDSNMTKILFYLYSTFRVRQKEVYHLQRGAAQPHVYPKDIMGLALKYPKSDLLNKFENVIKPFYEEIGILKTKNQILQETRDLLLPRLISGKLSVEDLNIVAGNDEIMNMAAEPKAKYN